MAEIKYKGYVLNIDGEKIQLPMKIMNTIQVDDKIVVDLNTRDEKGEVVTNNVRCFTTDGDQLWEIESPDRPPRSGEPVYTHVHEEDGELFAHNWNTYKYKVNLEDGSIKEIKKADK
jgi:hypothetical protein